MKSLITPQYISSLVNFGPDLPEEWHFDPNKEDMRNAQVKGAAHIYNILQKRKIALLADEVGMGKTIQALSVCAALWREKPDAKILIIAPREVVARNWLSEYSQFIRNHYRLKDDIVKSQSGELPVNEMVYCHNLFALTHNINLGWPKLMLAKTTSFSAMVSYPNIEKSLKSININIDEISGTNHEKNKKVCNLIRKKVVKGEPVFDLLIIDEAHYFRNTKNDTLRSITAKILFGEPNKDIPLADKVLLMTATPNHSSSEDIKNITSYFATKFQSSSSSSFDILKQICVRRLRRLSEKGITKYGYRKELDRPAEFEKDPLGELFFGLYHYELIQKIEKGSAEDYKHVKGITKLRSYLEGTEFIPKEDDIVDPGNEEEDETSNEKTLKATSKNNSTKQVGQDIGKGDDRKLLLDLSKDFNNIFNNLPHHPKYDVLTKELNGDCQNQKALIFVRRIASVYEINRRMINELDKELWPKLRNIPALSNVDSIPDREKFKSLLKDINVDIDNSDEDITTEIDLVDKKNEKDKQKIERIKKSDVLDLFVQKKEKAGPNTKDVKVDSTPASSFKLRFDPTKTSPFGMFFSPGPEYDEKPYINLQLLKYESGKKTVSNYFESALNHRLNYFSEWKNANRYFIKRKIQIDGKEENLNVIIPTFFSLFWSKIYQNKDENIKIINTYNRLTVVEKEALCKFIGEGLLSGSTVIVDLFVTFTNMIYNKNDEKPDALKDYLEFCSSIDYILNDKIIKNKICDSILNFKQIYSKVFNIKNEAELFNYDWNDFSYMNVYPFSAKNKNSSILNTFNTPFFPDYLVATSVLQEGVNLQFFCDKLFHYGAAWTPGDNEQRNGRIDRMFGLIERRLNDSKISDASLNLYYPYLKNSIDETNLSIFFNKKNISEKLIDEGKGVDDDILENQEEDPQVDWKSYLRSNPTNNVSEPYKVEIESFSGIKSPDIPLCNESINTFLISIKNTVESITELDVEITSLGSNIENGFAADPNIYYRNNKRRQPVIVELLYDSIGSSILNKSVYTLKMKTPLERNTKWEHVSNIIKKNDILIPEGVKVCLDNKTGRGNYWGLYLRTDLPLFADQLKNNPLSTDEIKDCFKNLVKISDQIEVMAFEGQDLTKKDLNLSNNAFESGIKENILKGAKGIYKKNNWRISNEYSILNKQIQIHKEKQNNNQKLLLEKNHDVNYIHFSQNEWGVLHRAYLYTKDATEIEYEFLEKYLNAIAAQTEFEKNHW